MAIVSRQADGGIGTTDLDLVFRAHYDAVYRVCFSRLGSKTDAEDAVQEVFCRAVRHREELVGDALPWLLRTATNLCADNHRRRATHPSELELDTEGAASPAHDDPERLVVGRMSLTDMLSCLTTTERKVVVEKWLLDGTHRSTGTTMGVSAGTTKKLLSRAKQRLVAYMEEQNRLVGSLIFAAYNHLPRRLRDARRSAAHSTVLSEQLTSMAVPAMVAAALAMSLAGGNLSGARPGGGVAGASAPMAPINKGANVDGGSPAPMVISSSAARPPIPPRSSDIVGPLIALNPPARQQDVNTSDVAVSPNYSSDHEILATGVLSTCTRQPCNVLFRTVDDGATWTQLSATALTGTQLLLPANTFAAGRFYAFGPGGLQVTTDGGGSFGPMAPYVPGYASAAPSWRAGLVSVSNADIWDFSAQTTPVAGAPTLDGAFPAGYRAAGPPVFTSNQRTFQPAYGPAQTVSVTQVLSCLQTCGNPVDLPWGGTTTLRMSPSFAVDGVIAAEVEGRGVAISQDGGLSYRPAALPANTVVDDELFTGGAGLLRLVALVNSVPGGGADSIMYSDDLGLSWTTSRLIQLPPAVSFSQLRGAPSSILIAATSHGDVDGPNGFACSRDGGLSWRDCSAS